MVSCHFNLSSLDDRKVTVAVKVTKDNVSLSTSTITVPDIKQKLVGWRRGSGMIGIAKYLAINFFISFSM